MNTRPIDPTPFAAVAAELPACKPGKEPTLRWLDITKLDVDPSYQREIGEAGKKNIAKIAREFDWSKFSPVVVSPNGGARFIIIDGQHRATAAAVRGIKKAPCQIVHLDRKGQAAAFAAINTVVTAMSPLQVHAAKIAAGDEEAKALVKCLASAGVTICRYPIKLQTMKVGETLAANNMYRFMRKFGPTTLALALVCITKTRSGYPGMVRAQLVEAFCVNLEAEPPWASDEKKLLRAVTKIDLEKLFSDVRKETEGSRGGIVTLLVERLAGHLEKELG